MTLYTLNKFRARLCLWLLLMKVRVCLLLLVCVYWRINVDGFVQVKVLGAHDSLHGSFLQVYVVAAELAGHSHSSLHRLGVLLRQPRLQPDGKVFLQLDGHCLDNKPLVLVPMFINSVVQILNVFD